MVGISTVREPNGIVLHKGYKDFKGVPKDTCVDIFLSQEDCELVLHTIQEAKRKYWKKQEVS